MMSTAPAPSSDDSTAARLFAGGRLARQARALLRRKVAGTALGTSGPSIEPRDWRADLEAQFDRVLAYVEAGKREGARIVHGGGRPSAPELSRGWFIEPTIFADVTADMTIAREEIFGPVLSILKWSDEGAMVRAVNNTEFGLTCSIWTNDLNRAHRAAMRVEAGCEWINHVGQHLLGAPFGGFKQSGMGREECLEELLSFTQEKNIYLRLS
jgi:betaine-aldehyde dehydrogenase